MRRSIGIVWVLCVLLLSIGSAFAAGVEKSVGGNQLVKESELAGLKDKILGSYEETEKTMIEKASTSILPIPVPQRFLMWTNDGEHVMWGKFRNGYFTGTDNNGKQAWGIYQKGIFAGFCGGELFYGKSSNGNWKAINLFGLKYSSGRYLVFPGPIRIMAAEAED